MDLTCNQPPADKEHVILALRTCNMFHFAGHGSSHAVNPLQSRLLLNDWKHQPLTVADLLDINLSTMPPFLAFLSACGTGQILDNRSVDEGIHLTSAFQLAGFRHVIGTLWEVDDEMCVDMASMTYEFMFHEGISDTSVSRGLHHATRALRDQWLNSQDFVSFAKGNRDSRLLGNKPLEMPAWVPYIHYGV